MRTPNFCFVFAPAGDNSERTIDQAVFFSEYDDEDLRKDLEVQATDSIGECELEAVFELDLIHGEGGGLHETSYTG